MEKAAPRGIFGWRLNLTDVLLLGSAGAFGLLIAIFHARASTWRSVLPSIGVCLVAYAAANVIARLLPWRFGRFFFRTAAVQLMIYFVYQFSIDAVHVFFPGWFDPQIIALEKTVTGGQPTLWLQRFVNVPLTEWLMFCYVFYVAVYPILSLILYFKHGEKENEEYLFYVSLIVVMCMVGFVLFPVAGPVPQIGGLFTVPLKGHFFTGISDLIRTRVHRPGGAFPSIHCGAATIMWWCAYRFSRPTFYVLAPVVLSLYVSTVYGRFHYATDVFAGIAAAFLAMILGNLLMRAWNRNRVGA